MSIFKLLTVGLLLLGGLGACAGGDGGGGPGDAGRDSVGGDLPLDLGTLPDLPQDSLPDSLLDTAAELPDLTPDTASPELPGETTAADLDLGPLDTEAGELPCVPVCLNDDQSARVCGPDGCGGLCGTCDLEHTCVAATGACMPLCEPQCAGKECGGDGCYGQCPPGCPNNYACGDDGHCYPDCDPFVVCKDRDCGPDGCGGSCGDCPQGSSCENASGKCLAVPCAGIPAKGLCVDDRVLVTCEAQERKETDCGLMEGGGYCRYNSLLGKNECAAGCLPKCQGLECGDDGCGGVCGTCPNGWACPVGKCEAQAGGECGWYAAGTCEQDVLWLCEAGVLTRTDCAEQSLHCGWRLPSGPFACLL
jgi:hypothetical protein